MDNAPETKAEAPALPSVPPYREDIFVKSFRKIRQGNVAGLDTCTCCGSGIARVFVLSNGWRLGPGCVGSRTTLSARDVRWHHAGGRKYLTEEAYETITSHPHFKHRVARAEEWDAVYRGDLPPR